MLIGRIEINVKAYWYFDSLFRRFLNKLVCHFGQPICGWWLLNKAYGIDNDVTYFIRNGRSAE